MEYSLERLTAPVDLTRLEIALTPSRYNIVPYINEMTELLSVERPYHLRLIVFLILRIVHRSLICQTGDNPPCIDEKGIKYSPCFTSNKPCSLTDRLSPPLPEPAARWSASCLKVVIFDDWSLLSREIDNYLPLNQTIIRDNWIFLKAPFHLVLRRHTSPLKTVANDGSI